MQLDLTDEERDALTTHLREHLQATQHPAAATVPLLKAILVKIDPTAKDVPLPYQR